MPILDKARINAHLFIGILEASRRHSHASGVTVQCPQFGDRTDRPDLPPIVNGDKFIGDAATCVHEADSNARYHARLVDDEGIVLDVMAASDYVSYVTFRPPR